MLKTVVFFTLGGFSSAVTSRYLMRLPLLYKPQLHAVTTALGFGVGTFMHQTEDRFFVWLNHFYEVPEDAPIWIQKKLKTRLDKVDLLNKIAEELPGDVTRKPYWEKRLESDATA